MQEKEGEMMIRVKVSYNTEDELAGVIRLLTPALKEYSKSANEKGRYKKAYIVLKSESVTNQFS